MVVYGTLATNLIRDFLVEEGLCDYQRALQAADRFERRLRECDCLETHDGTTYFKAQERHGTSAFAGRQLAF